MSLYSDYFDWLVDCYSHCQTAYKKIQNWQSRRALANKIKYTNTEKIKADTVKRKWYLVNKGKFYRNEIKN